MNKGLRLHSDSVPAADTLLISMDETEKTLSLKKACADMILNTAKEAAARVLAAERKAKKSQNDLLFTKDEAIRMLIRMKQKIEAKNTESGIVFMNQQRKIQELELQLDEAEGLILDLRAKLSKVEEQLDDAKCKPIHSLREKESVYQLRCHSSLSDLESKSVACKFQIPCSDHHFVVHQSPGPLEEQLTSNSDFDSCLVDNPVFDSNYFENGGPELYRNGCTQRIPAIEDDLVDIKMLLAGDSDSLVESISLVPKNEQLGVECIIPSTTNKLDLIENVVNETPFLIDDARKDWSLKVQKSCRRRTRQAKARGCRYISGRSMKSHRTVSAIARCRAYLLSSNNVERSVNLSKIHTRNDAENGSKIKRTGSVLSSHRKEDLARGKYEPVSVVRRSVRRRKVKHRDGFSTLCRHEETHPYQNEGSCQNSGVHCSAKCDEYLLVGKNDVEVEDGKCQAADANISKCAKACGDSGIVKVVETDSALIDVPMLVNRALTELENVLLVSSDKEDPRMSRLTNEADYQHQSSNSITCAFSRKRKQGLLMNPGENYASGESSMRRSSGEQTDIDLIPQTSCVVNESLNDSRGLVQIALQLISLSAKRW